MVEIGLITGILSYLVFGIGLIGKLKGIEVGIVSVIYLIFFVYFFIKEIKEVRKTGDIREITKNKTNRILTVIIFLSVIVNLIGVLGPELGFDALWYHLTIPKIFLQENNILPFLFYNPLFHMYHR